jgi:GDPmannose 4,6-dehydratase
MDRRVALVSGITGQTGSYLSELLLAKGYGVHGIIRRSSSFNTERIDHIFDKLHLHYGDMLDPLSLRTIVGKAKPDEVYNLAAQSHVRVSFDQPVYSVETVAMGCLHLLEAIRDYRDATHREVKFYQASSSEMFGDSPAKQSETTPFRPRSPYACAKVYAYHQTVNYRQAYGLFASNGILFNHESERRGQTFVTRKITMAASRIYYGLQDKLYLGNLDAKRDWGFAGDYADAIWRIVQHSTPDDFVVATGLSLTVRAWLELAFSYIDRDWRDHVVIDQRYLRPSEVPDLCGDASKAKRLLGWEATTKPQQLCDQMMKHDLRLAAWEAKRKQFEADGVQAEIVDKRDAEQRMAVAKKRVGYGKGAKKTKIA